ncbi:MAG: HAD hydrolase-like protein [Anaerostipes sp.]|nr:HAD hydrolase-like protein [Anaerostipes sp.]MDD3746646.1 HAD hydrolase-like protein [Anaerostipes sp.]
MKDKKFDGIIFDVDGTLWDVRDEIAMASSKEAHRQGYTDIEFTLEKVTPVFGMTLNEAADVLMPHIPPEIRYRLMEDCGSHQVEYVAEQTDDKAFEGMRGTLETLSKKYPLFIVSNCAAGYIDIFMRRCGVSEFITDWEELGRTGASKGENIKDVVHRNHLTSPVYIGDTAGDQKAATEAGVDFIFAKYGFGTIDDCKYTISDIRELQNL